MQIVFNTLKLSEDRKVLNIDVKLVNGSGEDYELKSIHIDDNLTYEGNWNGEPSERPLFSEYISGTEYKASLNKSELLRARTSQKSPTVKTATGNSLNSLSYSDPDPYYTGYPEIPDFAASSECGKFNRELSPLRRSNNLTPNRCCSAQYGTTFDNSFLLVYIQYESLSRDSSTMIWKAEFTDAKTDLPANDGDVVLSPLTMTFNPGDLKSLSVSYRGNSQASDSDDVHWQVSFTDDYTSDPKNVGDIVLEPVTVTINPGDTSPVTVTIGKDGKTFDGKVSGYVIGITMDWTGYYQASISYMKPLCMGACKPPLEFINHILLGKAIEYSILCGDYSEAIELWNCLFINNSAMTGTGGCGCRT